MLAEAARRRNLTLQAYLAEQIHLLAVRERNLLALHQLAALDNLPGGMTADELARLREETRAAHDEHLAEKSGIDR